ncbi:MAG TPA: OstA-like protein, partial [Flavobacteriaceae bacterium]|nr:OstA-like protein [Flavobacteriaceae bacterium]
MKTVEHSYFILALTCLLFNWGFAQEPAPKKIEIKYGGFLNIDEEKHPGAKVMTRDDSGQIHIFHEGVDMWCDQAIHYSKEDFIEAYGNVKMKQGDTIDMTAKHAEYSGKTKLAFASGDVVLTEPKSTLTTDTLYFDRVKQQSFYKSGGTVVRDSSGTITSNIGRYYMNQKKYQFINKVKLVNPEYVLETNRLDYYTESGFAFMYGPSTITGEASKIYCERGFYDTENDTGYFIKKSRIDYDNRIVEGDSMYFDRKRSFASANNNIKVTDTLNNSIIKGHYAEVYRERDSVFITNRALAITVQENDSIYIHGDTLMVTGKPEHRITRAFYNVKMYKSDMSGKADSIHVDHKSGLTQLINLKRFSLGDSFKKKRNPVLWNVKNQMTGDTIHIISNPETEKLDSLLVFENAFLVSKDTLGDGYNQIAGKELIGLFNDENQLYQVDIIKNAEVIYYFRNDEQELVGIDKSKSAAIEIFITNNEIDQVKKIKEVTGTVYPESMFPKNESLLRGFNWREEERPTSVEDLFSEDPPLELPKIQGLDDFVPAEDFFDDALMERVEKAEASETIKEDETSKASRNIPKEAKEKDSTNLVKPKLI